LKLILTLQEKKKGGKGGRLWNRSLSQRKGDTQEKKTGHQAPFSLILYYEKKKGGKGRPKFLLTCERNID